MSSSVIKDGTSNWREHRARTNIPTVGNGSHDPEAAVKRLHATALF